MKLKNKFISVSVALALSVSQLNAESFLESVLGADAVDQYLYMESTTAKNFKDPTTGMQYATGDSYSFRFKGSLARPTPLFAAAPPGIKAGCNGISIDGFFGAMIDLEAFVEQFQSASTALAYGFLAGIIGSTPILSEVFQKINEWGRMWQDLAQNACSKGMELAQNATGGNTMTSLLDEGLDDATQVKEWTDNPAESSKKAVEEEVEEAEGKTGELQNLATDPVNDATAGIFSIFGLLIDPYLSNDGKDGIKDPATNFYFKDIVDGEGITDSAGKKINITLEDGEKAVLLFAMLAMGEFVVDSGTNVKLSNLLDANAIGEALKAAVTGNPTTPAGAKFEAGQLDTDLLYDAILKGFTGEDDTPITTACGGAGSGKCNIKNRKYIYTKVIKGQSDAETSDAGTPIEAETIFKRIIATPDYKENAPVVFEWEDLQVLYETGFKNAVTKLANNETLSDINTPPLMYPNTEKFLNILVQFEVTVTNQRAADNTINITELTERTDTLIELLSELNANEYAFYIVTQIARLVETVISAPNQSLKDSDSVATKMQGLRASIDKIKEDAKKIRDQRAKALQSITAAEKIFKEIQTEILRQRNESVIRGKSR